MEKRVIELAEIQPKQGNALSEALETIDVSSLRLSQNFHQELGVKEVLSTVPVRKPDKQDFFRVNPAEKMNLQTYVLDHNEQRETLTCDVNSGHQ